MKIVVIGGSGLIGKKLVPILRERGHEAVPASPSSGVNALTGEGLAEALAGAQVVVDVSNSPSWADAAVLEFFETSTRNLLAAEKAAGVGHHVALSVVGADRLPDSGYMRAKVAQERLIAGRRGAVHDRPGHAVLRVPRRDRRAKGDGDTVRLPTAPMQPLAADDVAAALADVAVGPPVNGMRRAGGARVAAPSPSSWALPGRERGQADGGRGPAGPLLRRGAGRPRPEPRGRPAHRPDAVRGLVRSHRHGQGRSGPLRARARRVAVATGEAREVDTAKGNREC